MHYLLPPLIKSFESHADPGDAAAMRAYLKERCDFFGIKTPARRQLVKAHFAEHGSPTAEELPSLARSAFVRPQREMHYVAVDLLIKFAKKLGPEHLPLIEELITTKSWWDTVDALAVNVAGVILKRFPKEITPWNKRWVTSDDLWLNRTAILFQLKWKGDTDRSLLFANIDRHAGHTDFFIRKAIGWALREYGRTDPDAVRAFVATRKLSPLSVREALRRL